MQRTRRGQKINYSNKTIFRAEKWAKFSFIGGRFPYKLPLYKNCSDGGNGKAILEFNGAFNFQMSANEKVARKKCTILRLHLKFEVQEFKTDILLKDKNNKNT